MVEPPQGPHYQSPALTELSSLNVGAALRADTEQQQQQQQQGQQQHALRRFLNEETQLPEEEVVTRLTTEMRQTNRLAPRQER